MKALITGASGFIGKYLSDFLEQKGIVVSKLSRNEIDGFIKNDLSDVSEIKKLLLTNKPDYIFHLAAQSLVMPSWVNPNETFYANVTCTINLFEALREIDYKKRIIIFGSSSEYAGSSKKIKESDKLEPNSPYALSKLVQEELACLYKKSYGLDIVIVRPFYIIGPGKKNDVVSDFCRRLVEIENTKAQDFKVGNIELTREYLDIHDGIAGIWLVAQKGISGETYNICSGKPITIVEMLKLLLSFASTKIEYTSDKKLYRPIDEAKKVGDNTKLCKLGWQPRIPLDKTLQDTLDYWRQMSQNQR